MRLFLLLCWLSVPVLAWAYHLGPGQERLRLDETDRLLTEARQAVEGQDFQLARMIYGDALAALPAERRAESAQIQVELAKTQIESGMLPEARYALESLLEELQDESGNDAALVQQTRSALAQSQYLMTWLMRLEGQPAEVWEPEAEAARQHYRYLAEQALAASDEAAAEQHQHDLEATIRLARMDLAELQGLKIPSQCKGCCSGQCKKPGKKQGQKKSPKKGAGSNLGPLPDGSGA